MRFVLLSRFSMAVTTAGREPSWRPEDLAAHYRYVDDVKRALTRTGELVAVYELATGCQARLVRGDGGGPARAVRGDGGGPAAAAGDDGLRTASASWLVDCATTARATAIAARISSAPGAGGSPLNHPVELHPVVPFDRVPLTGILDAPDRAGPRRDGRGRSYSEAGAATDSPHDTSRRSQRRLP